MDGSTAWIRSLSRWANAAAPTMRTRKPWGWSAGGGGHGGGGGRHGRSSSGEREQGICRRRVASARFACLTPNRQPLSRFGHPSEEHARSLVGAALCRERAAKQPQSFSADAQIAGAASQPFRDTRPLPRARAGWKKPVAFRTIDPAAPPSAAMLQSVRCGEPRVGRACPRR